MPLMQQKLAGDKARRRALNLRNIGGWLTIHHQSVLSRPQVAPHPFVRAGRCSIAMRGKGRL
jgi:hypothetical protein